MNQDPSKNATNVLPLLFLLEGLLHEPPLHQVTLVHHIFSFDHVGGRSLQVLRPELLFQT